MEVVFMLLIVINGTAYNHGIFTNEAACKQRAHELKPKEHYCIQTWGK